MPTATAAAYHNEDTLMYQPTRRPLLAGMRRIAATIALAVIAIVGATVPAHAGTIPSSGVASPRVTQVQVKDVNIFPWGCRTATRERVGVQLPLGGTHWNRWSIWHIDGTCV